MEKQGFGEHHNRKGFLVGNFKGDNANYQGLKVKKDTLSIQHNKLQRDYKNMEETLFKQEKEVEELKVDNANAY